MRDRLPVRRAVRPADRGHARAGRAHATAARARERLYREALFAALPAPRGGCARWRRCSPLSRRLGVAACRQAAGARLRRARRPTPDAAARDAARACPSVTPARGELPRPRRAAPGLRPARRSSATSTPPPSRVLAAEGCEVHAPRRAALLRRAPAARRRRTRRASSRGRRSRRFEDFDAVAVNAAGCGSAMKDYAHLLRDDPAWAERAAAFAAKVRDVTELLADARAARAARHPIPLDASPTTTPATSRTPRACARRRATLLRRSRARAASSPTSCGDLLRLGRHLQPASSPRRPPSSARARRQNLLATGAEAIAAGNPGCALQIAAQLRADGAAAAGLPPDELLDRRSGRQSLMAPRRGRRPARGPRGRGPLRRRARLRRRAAPPLRRHAPASCCGAAASAARRARRPAARSTSSTRRGDPRGRLDGAAAAARPTATAASRSPARPTAR